jgi:hypothetical protein
MPQIDSVLLGIIGGFVVIAGAVYVAAGPELRLTSRKSSSGQPQDYGFGGMGDSGHGGSGWMGDCGHSAGDGGSCGDSGGGGGGH